MFPLRITVVIISERLQVYMCSISTALQQKGSQLPRVMTINQRFHAFAATNNVAMGELLHLGEQKSSKLPQIWICD